MPSTIQNLNCTDEVFEVHNYHVSVRHSFFMLAIVLNIASNIVGQEPIAVATSSSQKVRIEFSLQTRNEVNSLPHYRVTFDGKEIIGHSQLGMVLGDGSKLGGPCNVISVSSRNLRDEFTQITGKRRNVRVDANEVVIALQESTGFKRKWEVHIRASDDAASFRYHFPKQEGWESLSIKVESTEFALRTDARSFPLHLQSFTSSYEGRYQELRVGELPKDWLIALPLLVEARNGIWAAITEANVNEYAGMYLSHAGEGRLSARLSPLVSDPKIAVKHNLPHSSPWRVVLLGDRVGKLVESDAVLTLSDPCVIRDTSWIKTGKTTFPWWNGFYEENLGFKPGLNTETAKYYIDFCAKSGIPYHSLDGVGNTAWYGGPIVPYEGAEPTRGVDGLDLREVVRYAKTKGVGIRLWMNWMAAEAHMEKAFPFYRDLGIEGVMLDFMDRDDQEMNRFVRRAVALAAANRLTVTLHGCPKPTGLERTYPNLLSHEGVMNLEYDKWDERGITPEHEVTVPFTRMLAGPLDFHQGSFRTFSLQAFQPRNEAPMVIGTPARTLASYVVFQNHLSMVADYPSAYADHPALPVLAAIPTTWDDTVVVEGAIGEYIVVARRSGGTWHIGAMTNEHPRSLRLPLSFLGHKRYESTAWGDDKEAKFGISLREKQISRSDVLQLELDASGGAYVRIDEAR